jgi:hypothetical protein
MKIHNEGIYINKLYSVKLDIVPSINTLVHSLFDNAFSITPFQIGSRNISPDINKKKSRRANEMESHGRSERDIISEGREKEYGFVRTFPVFTHSSFW